MLPIIISLILCIVSFKYINSTSLSIILFLLTVLSFNIAGYKSVQKEYGKKIYYKKPAFVEIDKDNDNLKVYNNQGRIILNTSLSKDVIIKEVLASDEITLYNDKLLTGEYLLIEAPIVQRISLERVYLSNLRMTFPSLWYNRVNRLKYNRNQRILIVMKK